MFVDGKDNVWLAGSGEKDAQLLKFTREGKFLQQFGKPGTNGGSADTRNLGQPANLTIDPVSNEVYVADGYRNRRVIVLDAETFAFKRMWGAYGNKPDDTPLGPYNPDAPPAQQFRLPHNIAISRDGFVYVADRPNNRIQVFRKDGTYVKETFVSKRTLLQGAASGFALSTDPQQRWLYMIDGANHHVWILERQSLQIVARFGQQGLWGGALNVPHAIAVDGRGNIYVGENFDARRFQRFLYKGLGTPQARHHPADDRSFAEPSRAGRGRSSDRPARRPLADRPEDVGAPVRRVGMFGRIGDVRLPRRTGGAHALLLHPTLDGRVGVLQLVVRAHVHGHCRRDRPAT